MFDFDVDGRLEAWSNLRKRIDVSSDPLQEVVDFWSATPFEPHNHRIDHYYDGNWPTPWEIIEENHYDDFTKAVMIGYTLLLTERYKNSFVEIRTIVDSDQNRLYNVVCLENTWALNYDDTAAILLENIPSSCLIENLIQLKRPR